MEGVDLESAVWLIKNYGWPALISAVLAYAYFVQTRARLQDLKVASELNAKLQEARNESDRKLAQSIDRMAGAIEDRNRVSAELMMGYQALVAVADRSLAVNAERDKMSNARFDEIVRILRERRRP